MKRTRSEELRASHRKVTAWSFAIATLIYALVFFVWIPKFRVQPMDSLDTRQGPGDQVAESPLFVEVVFGPPEILASDGTVWQEPEDRVLEVGRVLELPPECWALVGDGREPASGLVRLRVQAAGRVVRVELTRSTGDICGDRVITEVADALWYQWLPDDRFPAPVDLIQPITLREVRN